MIPRVYKLESLIEKTKSKTSLKTERVPVTAISNHPYKNPVLLPQPMFYLLG